MKYTKIFCHFWTNFVRILVFRNRKRYVSVQQFWTPLPPFSPKNELCDLKMDQALIYVKHTKKFGNFWTTVAHLNFSSSFNMADIRVGRPIFFSLFLCENMSFHLLRQITNSIINFCPFGHFCGSHMEEIWRKYEEMYGKYEEITRKYEKI